MTTTVDLPDPATLDPATIRFLRWYGYRVLACPHCHVQAGDDCKSSGRRGTPGHQNSAVRHKPRTQAVAALPVDELVRLAWRLLPSAYKTTRKEAA